MKIMRSVLLLSLLATLLGGCQSLSGTRVESVSGGKATPATLDKLLVVGVTTTPRLQADMEKAFARAFDRHGRKVVLASEWYPGEKEPMRAEVIARVKAEGVSGVLVVRLLGVEVEAQPEEPAFSLKAPARVPGARVGWEQDPWVGSPGLPPAPRRKALVETRLYDVASGQVVWQAQSRSVIREPEGEGVDGFVAAIMVELHKSGWLPPVGPLPK